MRRRLCPAFSIGVVSDSLLFKGRVLFPWVRVFSSHRNTGPQAPLEPPGSGGKSDQCAAPLIAWTWGSTSAGWGYSEASRSWQNCCHFYWKQSDFWGGVAQLAAQYLVP